MEDLQLKKAIKMHDCTQNSYHSMEMVGDQQSKYLMGGKSCSSP